MRVITFSRTFPAYHPKKGQPTYFVEKIWKSMYRNAECPDVLDEYIKNYESALKCDLGRYNDIHRKVHTIRAGNRWKVGDFFSPRVWGDDVNPKNGRKGAYQSKQIEIAPPIEIKKIWEFYVTKDKYFLNGKEQCVFDLSKIAANDGLEVDDFELWFAPYTKKGNCTCQVLCWNESILY